MKRILVLLVAIALLRFLSLIYDYQFGPFYINSYGSLDPFWLHVIDLCLFSPIIEEMGFRYHLSNRNVNSLILSISFLIPIVILFFFKVVFDFEGSIVFKLILTIVIALISYFGFTKRFAGSELKNSSTSLHLIAMSFVFAIVHINSIKNELILDQLLFVVPLFFLGLVLGLIRIKYGIQYAILAHILYNLPTAITWYLMIS
ncbi:MAG: CPBP family intramembrane metalloprotease [Cyclobacteriaceae bacterium]|nr:CPBP family intramembrane metalloprotease [Cyclobacteriaceae bacterium HetDA_MAG_MS6]